MENVKNGQCFELDDIFYGLMMEVITDLVPFVESLVPATVIQKQAETTKKIDPNVKFVYFGDRSTANNHDGVITVASYVDEEKKHVYYGVAYCSPGDTYDKRKGKWLAYERLCTGQRRVGYNTKNHQELTTRILASIFAENSYPSWAKGTIEFQTFDFISDFY